MNVLITGATGLLGRYLISGKDASDDITALYFGAYAVKDSDRVGYVQCDVQHKDSLEKIFSSNKVDVVIHAGGIANVDFCETQYEIAYLSNVVGTQNVIDLCLAHGSKMVFVSSNAVFDGNDAPYKESDAPNPVNTYGKMKLECEGRVAAAFEDHLIIRPILMYGWNGPHERKNLATSLIERLPLAQAVSMVDDVRENPLYAGAGAEVIWKLIRTRRRGVYHVGGRDTVNRYQYALEIADVFGLDKRLVRPVGSSFFPALAPRPRDTSYDTSKVARDTSIAPLGLREGLLRMKAERGDGI